MTADKRLKDYIFLVVSNCYMFGHFPLWGIHCVVISCRHENCLKKNENKTKKTQLLEDVRSPPNSEMRYVVDVSQKCLLHSQWHFPLVHRCMQFLHLCLRTQTMTSLFPQPQKPIRKWAVVTTPFQTPASMSGFMMCQCAPTNNVHVKVMKPCPPKLFAANAMTLLQHMLGPFKEIVQQLLFTIYQNQVLKKSQVPLKSYRGYRYMTNHQLRGPQKNWFMQCHLRRNPAPKFLVIIYP